MRADGDVFVHGEAGEGLYDLERAYEATSRQKMRWHAGNVRPPVKNAAFARGQEAADNGKQRGFARAIGADKRCDPADLDGERSVLDGEQAAERLADALNAKQRLSHGRAPVTMTSGASNASAVASADPQSLAGRMLRRGRAHCHR